MNRQQTTGKLPAQQPLHQSQHRTGIAASNAAAQSVVQHIIDMPTDTQMHCTIRQGHCSNAHTPQLSRLRLPQPVCQQQCSRCCAGRLAAASGNYLHRVFSTASKQGRQQNARVGMMDLTRELSKAMEVIGAGNDAHRFSL